MKLHGLALATAFTLAAGGTASAMDGVVASIKPLHSLVAAVMGDTGTPRLLVGGNASPHTYSLKPSDAAALEKARLVFWIGPDMEPFLGKPLEALAGKADKVEMATAAGIELLAPRESGTFEHHDHGDSHDGHDHAHGEHDHGTHDQAQAGHDHDEEEVDMHFWLDPQNARTMAGTIRDALAKADPANRISWPFVNVSNIARVVAGLGPTIFACATAS